MSKLMPGIRFADGNDVEELVELGRAMVAEAESLKGMDFAPALLRLNLQHIIERGVAIVHVDEKLEIDGALLALLDRGLAWYDLTAMEMGFYVTPGARRGHVAGALVQRLVAWAKEHGAVRVTIGDGLGVAPEAVWALAVANGFVPAGVTYELRLG